MPERPDLRQIATSIGEALADLDRDTLADILTFVFKEYVVEGPPPLRAEEVDAAGELAELSFAELITALQTRLDHPELSLLRVEAGRVEVRVGGTWHPLEASAQRPEPAPAPTAAPRPAPTAATGSPRQQPDARAADPAVGASNASVDEALRRGRGDVLGGARTAPAPRGLSVRGQPAATPAGPASPAVTPEPARPEPPAAERSDAERGEGERGDGDDDASTRFSLLELD